MKEGILLVAFGSNNPQGTHALQSFSDVVRNRYPAVNVRWAFTSLLLRQRLAKERVKRDSVLKALQKMYFEKYTHVAIQPLHSIPGSEYLALAQEVKAFTQMHKEFVVHVGAPLLQENEDVHKASLAMIRHLPDERKCDESVVFMGHGAVHMGMQRYVDLANAVLMLDVHVHVGTMDGMLTLDTVLPKLNAGHKVWLMPLLSVVGQHALEDMAGKDTLSWRSQIEAAGFVCRPVLRGLVEYEGFMDIWLTHLQRVMDILHKN